MIEIKVDATKLIEQEKIKQQKIDDISELAATSSGIAELDTQVNKLKEMFDRLL